jgi:hypothetical protein
MFLCPILYLYSPRALLCFLFIFGTDKNDLIGQIPTELQNLPLLARCVSCLPPPPFHFVLLLQGFSHTLAIVIIHIVEDNCFDSDSVADFSICDTSRNCE